MPQPLPSNHVHNCMLWQRYRGFLGQDCDQAAARSIRSRQDVNICAHGLPGTSKPATGKGFAG